MLINFTVSNFKSFDKELMLNLSAAKRFSLADTISSDAYKINVLPVTGIYGANGSGKSNLVNAIDYMKRRVTANHAPFPVPFRFDSSTKEAEPSSFSALFIARSNVMYHYGFSVCGNEILEEWLSAYYEGRRESMLFERSRNSIEENEFEFSFGQKFVKASVKGRKSYLDFTAAGLKSTQLLVTELAQKDGNDAAEDVFNWFSENLTVIKPDAVAAAVPFAFIMNSDLTDEVSSLLQDMDFDFDGFEIASRTVSPDYLLSQWEKDAEELAVFKSELESPDEKFWFRPSNRYVMIHKSADGTIYEKTLLLKHRRKDGSTALLTVDEASSGFRRMLDLVILLLDSEMMRNTTVVIDEIERSLHTVISKNLVEMLRKNSVQKGLMSQLVFITHDTNLLDLNLLRRDEIQFMEKDRESGSSCLTNFAEFRISPGINVEKGYLDGRFGAIPLLHHNLDWRKYGRKNP